MKRRTSRANERAKRKAAREVGQKRPSGQSNYGRKSRWLNEHGMWGFDVPSPKPWK